MNSRGARCLSKSLPNFTKFVVGTTLLKQRPFFALLMMIIKDHSKGVAIYNAT
jgi:hypothetical protein